MERQPPLNKTKMKYPLIRNNVWITPIEKNYKLICCDCGLTHETDFRVNTKGQIQFRVRRVNK